MLKRLIKTNLTPIYLNNLLRGIGFSLFGIFIPIYFLQLGYSLQSVFIYFLIMQTLLFISLLVSYYFSKKFGYKSSIILNIPLTIIFLLIIQFLETKTIPIYIVAIIAGLTGGFYYLPMHAFFSSFSKKNKKGTQLGIYNIFGQVAGLIGPLIGALIATFFGFKYLFLIVLFFITISIIPLFYLKNLNPKNKMKLKEFFGFTKKHKGFFVGTVLDNIEGEIEGHIWPIFAFLILKDLISIGWIAFFVSIGTIIFTFFVGKHYDKKSKYFFLRLGGILFALIWFARAFYDNSWFIFISSLLAGFVTIMFSLSFELIFYEKVKKDKDPDAFIIYREIPSYFGRALIWIIAILLIDNFKVFFITAGLSYLIISFLKFGIKEHKKKKT